MISSVSWRTSQKYSPIPSILINIIFLHLPQRRSPFNNLTNNLTPSIHLFLRPTGLLPRDLHLSFFFLAFSDHPSSPNHLNLFLSFFSINGVTCKSSPILVLHILSLFNNYCNTTDWSQNPHFSLLNF